MCDRNGIVLGAFTCGCCISCTGRAIEPIWTYETANESMNVAFHVRQRPPSYGTNVRPSGRFPSPRTRPAGSLVAGMSARFSARQMMSLSCWCWCCVCRKDRASALAPHGHIWSSYRLRLSLSPTAIHIIIIFIIIIIIFSARKHEAFGLKIVNQVLPGWHTPWHKNSANNVFLNASSFPLCSDMDSLWKINCVSTGSSVI